MEGWNFIFITLVILKGCSMAFLTEEQQKISGSLMNALSIYHMILLDDSNLKLKNLQIFKGSIFWGKATTYSSTIEILKYFRKKAFPEPSTIIIFKTETLKTVVAFLKKIAKIKKSQLIAKFTWLVFVDFYEINGKDEKELLIPFDSDFIISYPHVNGSYKLVEVYKVKNKIMRLDFGVWDAGKLEITSLPWYRRRRNLKNETLFVAGLTNWGQLGQCSFPRTCAYLAYLRILAETLNSSLEWFKFSSVIDGIANFKKMDLPDYGSDLGSYYGFFDSYIDLVGPMFKSQTNWYISEPSKSKRAYYYIQPFEAEIWGFFLLTAITGGLLALLINYLLKTFTGEHGRELFDVKSHFFIPVDCLCNQEGTKPGTRNSSRILCFFIRFLALFMFGIYSATITSFSAVLEIKVPFRNVDEFLKNGEYSIIVPEMFASAILIHSIYHKMKEKVYISDGWTDMLTKVCEDDFAIIAVEKGIVTFDCSCKLYEIEKPLSTNFFHANVFKNSPFKKIIKHFLLDFYSSGIRQLLYQASLTNPNESRRNYVAQPSIQLLNWDYVRYGDIYRSETGDNTNLQSCSMSKENTIDFDYVKFEQIWQILALFVIGVLISLVICSSEILFSHLRKKGVRL